LFVAKFGGFSLSCTKRMNSRIISVSLFSDHEPRTDVVVITTGNNSAGAELR